LATAERTFPGSVSRTLATREPVLGSAMIFTSSMPPYGANVA